jgi:valyl-tRNA synthetase
LGNSPEPLDLIDKYGADGVRVGMLLCSPAGNDLLYEDSLPEQGRNFANKIWNAFRLVKSWEVAEDAVQPESSGVAVAWMNEVMNKSISEIDNNFRKFRISEALMTTYRLFWDEFSGWYLEIIKPEYQKPIDIATYEATLSVFDRLLKVVHPFMPFITEEIWQLLVSRNDGESIMISRMPESKKFNKGIIESFEAVKETISAVRTTRKNKDIPNKEKLTLLIRSEKDSYDISMISVIRKLCNLSDISFVSEKQPEAVSFMVRTTEYFIPLSGSIDIGAEIERLQTDLKYQRGFLSNVMKKLENERFVQNAPSDVLELERKKQSDAESKINALENRMEELKKL